MTAKKPRKEAEHPVVSGRATTFAALADALRVRGQKAKSPATIAQKYYRIKKVHGKVTMAQLQSPWRNPKVEARVVRNAAQREIDQLVRHARQHGPTHTAGTFNVDREYVEDLVRKADRKLHRGTHHDNRAIP